MVIITQRPSRTITGPITSRWTAAHNPVIYKFARRDREVSAVIIVSGDLRLTMDSVAGLIVGQSVYVNTTKYKGVGTIDTITAPYIFVSGFENNGSDTTGYVNDIKRNYKIEIKIYEAGNNLLLGSTSCVPFTTGIGSKNLSLYVSAYLENKNDFGYDVVNQRDTDRFLKFYITYRETWTDGSADLITDAAQPIYAVNAAKQLGDLHGQNMGDYTPSYVPFQKGKFLTKFRRPVYFPGYPFSLSFIYSELANVTLSKRERRLNVNRAQQSENSLQLDAQEREAVNRITLTGGYPSNVKYITLDIITGDLIEDAYTYPGYVEDGYVAQL